MPRENRQMAVKAVSESIDLLLVVGSQNSSNSKRLVEVGDNFGVRSYLVNDRSDVDVGWLEGVRNVGGHGGSVGARAPGAGTDRIPARSWVSTRWRKSNWWMKTCGFRCRRN